MFKPALILGLLLLMAAPPALAAPDSAPDSIPDAAADAAPDPAAATPSPEDDVYTADRAARADADKPPALTPKAIEWEERKAEEAQAALQPVPYARLALQKSPPLVCEKQNIGAIIATRARYICICTGSEWLIAMSDKACIWQ